jgi:hypothetical protein
MTDALVLAGFAWGAVALLMLALWVVHVAIRNAAIMLTLAWGCQLPCG